MMSALPTGARTTLALPSPPRTTDSSALSTVTAVISVSVTTPCTSASQSAVLAVATVLRMINATLGCA